MNTSESEFIKYISSYLYKNYSIQLSILQPPSILRPVVNCPTIEQNRYQAILNKVKELMSKKLVKIEKIKQLGSVFFQALNKDISTLQKNNAIRNNHTTTKNGIQISFGQAKQTLAKLEDECREVQGKSVVFQIVKHSYSYYAQMVKKYLNYLKELEQIPVESTLHFNLHEFQFENEEYSHISDYDRNFSPLMQLILKVKNILMNQYKQLVEADDNEQPISMITFLANSKKLILQLSPFLMEPQCTFDRLVLHVYNLQKSVVKLTNKNYQKMRKKWEQINLQICKGIYLGEPIRSEMQRVRIKISQQTEKIVRKVTENVSEIDDDGLIQIQNEIKVMFRKLGCGKVEIMQNLLNRKISKRKKVIEKMSDDMFNLYALLKKKESYYNLWKKLKETKLERRSLMDDIARNISTIQNSIFNKVQVQPIFQTSFLAIQAFSIKLHKLKQETELKLKDEGINLFKQQILPIKISEIKRMIDDLVISEQKLIAAFHAITEKRQNLSVSAMLNKDELIDQCNIFIKDVISNIIGFSLRKEEKVLARTKRFIEEMSKTQDLLNLSMSMIEDVSEMGTLKNNLEWVAKALDNNFGIKFVEQMMNQLNFQFQDWKERINNFKNGVNKLQIYVEQLKKITSAKNLTELLSPVHRLVRDKTQLFQILLDIFMQCLYVFEEGKKQQQYHLDSRSFSIFDEQALNYVYMMYQFKKKLREESQELHEFQLPKTLKDYLKNEIYDKFINNFNQYVSESEEELEELSMRMENAVKFLQSHENIFGIYEKKIKQTKNKKYKEDLIEISQEIVAIEQENRLIMKLQESRYRIKKLGVFEDLHSRYEEYFKIAREVVKSHQNQNFRISSQSSDRNISILRNSILNKFIS